MSHNNSNATPLSFIFSLLAKNYLGALSKKCEAIDLERYHYTLLLIYNGNEKITQQELANFLKIDKTSMVRIIDSLVKHNFVERKTNVNDRRQHLLTATSKGNEAAKKIKKAIEELNKKAFEGISENKQQDFYDTLGVICANLSQLPSDNFFLNFKKVKE